MIAVILAAGRGRRIAELTEGLPKCFLTLGGKRIIDHQIESLNRLGVDKIVIVVGYRSDLFEREYSNRGIIFVRNPFYDRTNVLASLWFARDYLHKGFYFMHADTYFDPSILEDLKQESGEIVLCVNKKDTVAEDMKVRVQNDRIVEINKEMPCESAYGEFTGLAKIDNVIAPKVIDCIRDRIENQGKLDDFFEAAIQEMIDKGVKVRKLDIGNRVSIEIDFAEDYELAKQLYKISRNMRSE